MVKRYDIDLGQIELEFWDFGISFEVGIHMYQIGLKHIKQVDIIGNDISINRYDLVQDYKDFNPAMSKW